MLGPHSRVLEGFVQPLLNALVLDDFCAALSHDGSRCSCVAVGLLDALACQQSSAQHAKVSSSVAALDAMDQDVVPIPHRVLHRGPNICPLLIALLAVGRRECHQLSSREGHPPRLSGPFVTRSIPYHGSVGD